MAQEVAGVSAERAASLVGIISIANGAGRFLWAWLSDFVGRRMVFLMMFPIQAVVFFALPSVHGFAAFTLLACVMLLCYGGGFGTMPAFTADYFGAENVGSIYGLMLTAWGVAGVLGPTLIAALRQSSGRLRRRAARVGRPHADQHSDPGDPAKDAVRPVGGDGGNGEDSQTEKRSERRRNGEETRDEHEQPRARVPTAGRHRVGASGRQTRAPHALEVFASVVLTRPRRRAMRGASPPVFSVCASVGSVLSVCESLVTP